VLSDLKVVIDHQLESWASKTTANISEKGTIRRFFEENPDCSKVVLKDALNALTGVTVIDVMKYNLLNNGAMFTITFSEAVLDVGELTIADNAIVGSDVNVEIQTTQDRISVAGSFVVLTTSSKGVALISDNIPYNATDAQLKATLEKNSSFASFCSDKPSLLTDWKGW
jgi:hypothetical protein